jgi:hypothetical protein
MNPKRKFYIYICKIGKIRIEQNEKLKIIYIRNYRLKKVSKIKRKLVLSTANQQILTISDRELSFDAKKSAI